MNKPIFIVRSKTIPLVFISLVILMMITSGSFHFVLADPLHCDIEGWASCYSVGYSHGLANPGTNCPSGHSDNYCSGWDAAARMQNTQAIPQGCGYGYDNSTCSSSNPQTTTLPQGCGYGYDNSTCSSSNPQTTTLPQGCGYGYDNSTCSSSNPQTTTLPQGCGYGYDNSTCSSQETGLNYTAMCQTLQPVLIPRCDTLVNDDGSLTPNGTHAMHCIRNGFLLGGTALLLHPNPALIPLILKGLSILLRLLQDVAELLI